VPCDNESEFEESVEVDHVAATVPTSPFRRCFTR
jgi:hypothetical protein